MLTSKSKSGRDRIRRRRHRHDAIPVHRRLWDLPFFGTGRTSLLGFVAGIVLGCLFGAFMTLLPGSTSKETPKALGVNPRTGHPQLHVKGQPEIPDVK